MLQTRHWHARYNPSLRLCMTKGNAAMQYQDMDMFPSLEGNKGAVEAFSHSAAAMEPAGAEAEEDEPKEAAPAPEPAAITA